MSVNMKSVKKSALFHSMGNPIGMTFVQWRDRNRNLVKCLIGQ